MKLSDGISMSARDIKRRKLRSILTIIAISVGSMLLVSMQGLGDTITTTAETFISSFGNLNEVMVLPEKYNADKSGMQINEQMSSGSHQMLPYTENKQLNPKQESNEKLIYNSTLAEIAKVKDVKSMSAYTATKATEINIDGVSKAGDAPLILGYAANYTYAQGDKIIAGKDLTGAKDQILINESYLKDMGITDYNSVIGKKFTLTVKIPEMSNIPGITPLKITGIVQGVYKEPNAYYPGNIITVDTLTNKIQAYYAGENPNDFKTTYSMVSLQTENQKVIPGIKNDINKNLGYTTFSLGEVVGIASIFTGFIKGILDVAAIIVIAVASVGLINTMTMTVQEKKKWIGIMRSIGASKGGIRVIFLTQSIILGTLGGILGCLLAIVGVWGINEYLIHIGKDFIIHLTTANVALGFIVSIIVAILAGIMPANRAAKLDVVETINEE